MIKTNCAYCGKCIERKPNRVKKHNYCNASHQLHFEYNTGIRNKKIITKKANDHVRKFGQPSLKGNIPWNKGLNKYDHPSIMRQAQFMTGKNNPAKRPEARKKRSEWCKKYYKENPDKHPNRIIAKRMKELGHHYASKNQLEMYYTIKKYYPSAELEHPVDTGISIRFIDVAIPEKKVGFEYDGEYWHQDKNKDELRDKELANCGWTIIRITKKSFGVLIKKLQELI